MLPKKPQKLKKLALQKRKNTKTKLNCQNLHYNLPCDAESTELKTSMAWEADKLKARGRMCCNPEIAHLSKVIIAILIITQAIV